MPCRSASSWLSSISFRSRERRSRVIVLVSILIGADLAGVLGALAAIPIAGSIQVILAGVLAAWHERIAVVNPPPGGAS
jgi:predicted PurR-regulated permease PerM